MTRFEDEVAPLRGELLAHCSRMLGSRQDGEDALQEALLHAWRGWEGFEGRSSVRTWLYTVATRACIDAARTRRHTPVPVDADAGSPAEALGGHPVQPFPDDRADVRLALVAGLRLLPPTQRAALLLREVLGFRAAEVARMLGTSVPAVKSSLQRARARLGSAALVPYDVVEPRGAVAAHQLGVYLRAFETGDVTELVATLRTDATLELRPVGARFEGKARCAAVLHAAAREPGGWRMGRAVANGQPAAVVHRRGKPYGVAVLDARRDGIAGITVFADPDLVDAFAAAGPAGSAPARPPPLRL
ncbi:MULTISPECIES: RNA polymerase subunit sigma-70 [unclassified Isoptericola]|uniref:RNA polymerase subunit sigma-70 n=1 Tax=unclassified Isoptericola TaxID=2623355 RepID=UPI00365EC363